MPRSDKTTVTRTTVTTQVKINFPANEIEHIIRCWIDQSMSDNLRPRPKNIYDITFTPIIDGMDDEVTLIGYEAVYQPATDEQLIGGPQPEAVKRFAESGA